MRKYLGNCEQQGEIRFIFLVSRRFMKKRAVLTKKLLLQVELKPWPARNAIRKFRKIVKFKFNTKIFHEWPLHWSYSFENVFIVCTPCLQIILHPIEPFLFQMTNKSTELHTEHKKTHTECTNHTKREFWKNLIKIADSNWCTVCDASTDAHQHRE